MEKLKQLLTVSHRVLVPAKRFKYPWMKKLAKLEATYEQTPEKCVVKRARLLAQAKHLMKRHGVSG